MDTRCPTASSGPGEDSPPYDRTLINELLKRKRKARELKACYPCRQRKVKCDGELPCHGCVQRQHSELCVMLGPAKRCRQTEAPLVLRSGSVDPHAVHSSNAASSGNPFDAMLSRLTAIEDAVSALKGDLLRLRECDDFQNPALPSVGEPASSESSASVVPKLRRVTTANNTSSTDKIGIHARDDTTGVTVYLGRNSVPAFVLGQQGSPGNANPHRMNHDLPLQVFALHNSTITYPFTHLWSPQVDVDDITQALPSDKDIMRYFGIYRDRAHRIYPVIVDIGEFETDLCNSLRERATDDGGFCSPRSPWKNPSWVALLFAILASGTQFSDDARQERELSSRAYVCCSFQCLRIANFFIQPTTEQIQSLLLLGNCIRNDTNPGAAWILLGLTIRLAQSIGLHQKSISLNWDIQEQHRKIWWSVVWQDALLSFSYDRPHGTVTIDCGVPKSSVPQHCINFMDLMYDFLRVVIDFSLHNDLNSDFAPTSETIQHFRERLETIRWNATAGEHSVMDQLERFTVRIHTGYMISQICRFALRRPDKLDEDGAQEQEYTAACLENAADVIQAFIEMHSLSPAIVRSWAFMHNVLSCALLLGLLPGALKKREMQRLLKRMIECLEEIEADASGESYSKTLAALKDLYESRVTFGDGVASAEHELQNSNINGDPWDAPNTALLWNGTSQSRIMDSIIWGWNSKDGLHEALGLVDPPLP